MAQAAHKTDPVEPVTMRFGDDGVVPNNPTLPLLVYRGAIDVSGQRDPAARIERIFAENGWGDSWRNGIYAFTHFHSMIHEALGVAAGRARVRFGGKAGEELEIEAGDVAVVPAGTGHQRIAASRDFLVVGAYPAQGTYDLCRATPAEHARAKELIAKTPFPAADPVYGKNGPLLKLWQPEDRGRTTQDR
jgi:uncharacterized protein YjlB